MVDVIALARVRPASTRTGLAGYDPSSWACARVRELGWWHDRIAHRWRAPDELIDAPFLTVPEEAETIAITLAPAHYGWSELVIATGTQHLMARLSAVFDPLPELLDWLEALVDCRRPRIEIDGEGRTFELHVLPPYAAAQAPAYPDQPHIVDPVRLVCIVDVAAPAYGLDVIVPRAALAASPYGAVMKFREVDPERYRMHWNDEQGTLRRITLDRGGHLNDRVLGTDLDHLP